MSSLSLIIFDCDGVLVDSEMLACRADAECLAEIGIAITAEEILERYVGISLAGMLADLAARSGRALPHGFSDTLRQRTRAAFEAGLTAVSGVAGVLSALTQPVCVASSSEPSRIRHALSLVGLRDRFEPHIFSATQVPRGKPAPDLFLFAAAQMNASPAACVVIEDSVAGVQAACAAGIRVVGFTGASHCRPGHDDRLRQAGAAAVFNDMAALPGLLVT